MAVERDVRHVRGVVDEIRFHAERTNGRVTLLERWQIEITARDDERRKVAADLSAAAEARRARRHWLPNAATGVLCVTLGWALSHFL